MYRGVGDAVVEGRQSGAGGAGLDPLTESPVHRDVGPTSRLLAPGQSARKTVGRIQFRECSVGVGLRAARRRRRSIEDAGPDPSLIGIY